MSEYVDSQDWARAADEADALRDFRDEFNFPPKKDGRSCVYLCGNSLGLQPELGAQYVREELEDWANLAVDGHHDARRPWLPYHRLATKGLAAR